MDQVTVASAVTTASGSVGYSQDLVITLSVLTAIFGLSTIALILYIVITRCRRPAPADQEHPVSASVVHTHDSDHATIVAITSEASNNGGVQQDPDNVHFDQDDESQDVVSSLRRNPIKPKYSCRYARQTLDVFSSRAESTIVPERISNIGILQNAQNIYHTITPQPPEHRGTRTIESVLEGQMVESEAPDIEDIQAVAVDQLGKVPTAVQQPASALTAVDIRPKSFFNTVESGSSVELKPEADVSRGMFVTKKCHADKPAVIELYGIKLEIPAGALKKTESVSLGILWSDDHQLSLAKSEAMICPIVSCEPHDLSFGVKATLTIPHCAHDVKNAWKIRIRESRTTATKKPVWKVMNDASYELQTSKIKLTIDHFTLYTMTGEAASTTLVPSKWVELIAFAPPLKGTEFKLWVFCVNDYDEEEKREAAADIKKMERAAKKMDATQKDSAALLFHQDSRNLELSLSVDKESAVWKVADMCKAKQELDFMKIWHSRSAEGKYVLTSGNKQSSKIMCRVDGHQLTHDEQVEILIAEEALLEGWINTALLDPVFPKLLRDEIVKLLDPKRAVGSYWEHLLENMDKTMTELTWLEDNYKQTGRSPTVYLLQDWAASGKTLKQFDDVMVQLERMDIHSEITTFLSQKKT